VHIDIVADLICPWCFIGKRRLERALAMRPELEATLAWRAFRLNPELPEDGIPRERYLAARFGGPRGAAQNEERLLAAGRAEGIEFAFSRIRRTPNTLRAHRLVRRAGAAGIAEPVVEALFRGYFLAGADLGDIATLAALAAPAGLDEADTRAWLEGDEGTAEVVAEDRRARRLGIHAVPCFVLEDGYAISGAQEPEMFLPLFDVAAAGGSIAAAG